MKQNTKLLLIMLIFVIIIIFPNLGRYLVVRNKLNQSDIIIVPTGDLRYRVPHSVEVYKQGYSNKIVFVNTISFDCEVVSSKTQEIIFGKAQLNKKEAIKLGVPEEDIIILEGNAQSTRDEAIIFRDYLKINNDIESIILVTSKYHSRRAKIIFTKVLNKLNRETIIYSSPSEYDPFNEDRWWKNKNDVEAVFWEYLKIFYFYFKDFFSSN